ncbi:MAG TPA: radical SAM protein [Candidatus Sulfotelmatobacter sp.]|nr:radical SAM protein [Candidatus Sulfotelmatobacter sp.]
MRVLESGLAASTSESGVLVIHLLNRCNLHCRHCYMNAVPDGGNILPADIVCRALQEAKLLGIRTVHLTGGEPFVYPEIHRVLEFASGLRDFQLFISTNGTRIGSHEAQWMKAAGAGAQISIDGPEEYHDRFRGMRGAFAASNSAIQMLVAAGVPVTVVVTITGQPLLPAVPRRVGVGRRGRAHQRAAAAGNRSRRPHCRCKIV